MPALRALAGAAAIAAAATTVTAVPAVAHSPERVRCGTSSLVAAITRANARGFGDLTLARGCVYDFTAPVAGEDATPPLRVPVTIDGNGATLRRGTTARLFRLLDVAARGRVTLSDLKIENGEVTGDGGGVLVRDRGTLRATSVRVTGNTARNNGGGIENMGTLKLVRSTVADNRAAASGGGISTEGSASVVSTSIERNTAARFFGGGVFNDNRITITRSSITGNKVTAGDGGGLWNNFRMTVDDSTIADNTASDHGGGVTNAQLGRATFHRSTIKRNTALLLAGGIYNVNPGAHLVLDHSSVTKNGARNAPGGVFNDIGSVVVNKRSPITGNRPTNCVGSPSPVPGCTG
ncbi:right-handed parallel beta-helix repeat-containing protein [Streptomyces sp. NPDC004528]|uniref:right-handed parallel beta-helix repeat-containing protein n=1 Tax=Streptomyces sp. NPDC004528 TaxID=3154550 RepID=UPI0033B697FB